MHDEPTPGEIMRRLDEVARQMTELARTMAEDRKHSAQTYVRQDVYIAQRQADHAVVADLSGDVRLVAEKLERTEDKRRAGARANLANAIAVAGVVIALLALFINRGTL